MEVSGVVSRHVPCFSGAGIDGKSSKPSIRVLGHRDFGVSFGPRRLPAPLRTEFADMGHIEYYYKVGQSQSQSPRCGGSTGGKRKMKKNKDKVKEELKFLKALSSSNNFSPFAGMDHQVQANLVSEAADVLLKQLEEIRAQEEELKRKRKQEKTELKAARMASMIDDSESSSSSSSESSESSDSECGEVVDMNQPRSEPVSQPVHDHDLQQTQEVAKLMQSLPSSLSTNSTDQELNRRRGCECGGPSSNSSCGTSSVGYVNGGGLGSKRVEVCMGNKCRKSGGATLMEEFERVMGAEGAVVGCKCMGKCKSGPNVRVLNGVDGESMGTTTNPLCIGVGLEDVSLLVANLFGEENKDVGLATAV
ncbi:Thioredoxin-like fold containing protein [Trema orientale]|uniref:Thioredoxin-like fold containing protein n=1 Tax=Trema orientale TaxID=63057 RepID=A0A2P5F5Z9_TREOI|nr:Thioredoxin-like fold containing protein [Trema orientale]